jgi:FMN-binding domain
MRRVILAVTGTIAGLVALLAFRSHVPSAAPAVSEGAAGTQTAGSPSAAASPLPSGARAIDGKPASTIYGPVQVQVVVRDDKITGVNILEQPHNTVNDLQIGQFAFPKLISETLAAQNAHVDAVSGASYTSAGYIQSLQSAVDNGA